MARETPYADNVMPAGAFDALASDPDAMLVDVRSEPPWRFVG